MDRLKHEQRQQEMAERDILLRYIRLQQLADAVEIARFWAVLTVAERQYVTRNIMAGL